ncbi:MAG: hypothetical protein PWP19_1772, partial [Thermococcaceae archaeon]|nr:hypothetical protein [Thermococcaceae archaeon]
FRVFESVIPSGDHDNHLKEFSKNPNKGYYKHALLTERFINSLQPLLDWAWAGSSAWDERRLGKAEAPGSNPGRSTTTLWAGPWSRLVMTPP